MVIYSMNQYNTEGLFSCPPVKEGVTALGAACAVKMENVTKRFGKVVANSAINLELHEGEILSLLGENGSGKTTLMNMLSGIYFPDEGQIYIHGEPVTIASPKDAFEHGIGMIHQHFKLVDVFSATENIALSMGSGEKFDLVFLDPPYDTGLLEQALQDIAGFDICREHGIIMAESPADAVLPPLAAPYRLYREYRYGRIKLTVYHRQGNEE